MSLCQNDNASFIFKLFIILNLIDKMKQTKRKPGKHVYDSTFRFDKCTELFCG